MRKEKVELSNGELQQFKLMRVRSLTDIGGNKFLIGAMALLAINTTVGLINISLVIGTPIPGIIMSVLIFCAVLYLAIDPERNYEASALTTMVALSTLYIIVMFGYDRPELVLTWMFGQLLFTIYAAGFKNGWPLVAVLLFLIVVGSLNTDPNNLNLTTTQFMITFIVPFFNTLGFLTISELRLESFFKTMLRTNDSMSSASARLQLLFETINEGLIITDTRGTIDFINDRALKELRVDENQMRHRLITEALTLTDEDGNVVPKASHPFTVVAADKRIVEVGFLSQHRQQIKRADGSLFFSAYTVSPIIHETHMIGSLMLFRDISDLDSTDKAKTEFVSLASHQLRTPLSVIAWYSEKLATQKKGPLNKKQADYLSEIQNSSRRMTKLVSELLNVSRVEMNRIKISLEDVNVKAITEQVVGDVSQSAKKKRIKIEIKDDLNKPMLKNSDQSLVGAIIENLLTNAIKYSAKNTKIKVVFKSVTVGEEIDTMTAPNDGIVITVADQGVGIPSDERDKIFSKMFRAENAKLMDVEGTGLGLYLSKKFVEAMNGRLWFTSIEDKGATFYLFLPRT